MRDPLAIFRSRRMAVVFLLGFSSGLPLMLTGQTLSQWLIDTKVDLKELAAFAAIRAPYSFKVLWAPLVDRYALPFLGRRRGWLLVFQLLLIVTLIVMSSLDPRVQPWTFALVGLIIATISASQDIVVDAYNADILEPEQRAAGSATYVMGYRLAMLVSGSLALVLADHIVWRAVYLIMAALMIIGIVATFMAEEPTRRGQPRTLLGAVVVPFVDFFRRLGWQGAVLVLLFCATYKFGEQFAQVLTPKFYRDTGFTKTEIGIASKAVGFAAWLVGGAIGGPLVAKYGVRRTLVAFGLVQATTHLAYLGIAAAGDNLYVFSIAIFIENVSFAMATSAFVASQMSFTSPAVSATQYALLTSLSGVGQNIFGFLAGPIAEAVGWQGFFLVTISMCLPGILLAWLAIRFTERRGSASASSAASPA